MPKIAMLGAGSAVFARRLMTDIIQIPGIAEGTFALVDIDPRRLELAARMAERLIEQSGKSWRVEADTSRRRVLEETDYLINFIEVSGLETVRMDYEIPLRYGVDQCIGDTIGPGGLFKALRTVPDWLDILRDAEELCPRALVMNYTNPMSVMTLAGLRATGMSIVGLCHSVQGSFQQLAGYLDLPGEEITWQCGGINHMAWFTELKRNGEDLYPRLRERGRIPEVYEKDPVRFELMYQLGAFVTESSGHNSEYHPWFRKRDDLIEQYCRDGFLGGRGFYAKEWPKWRKEADDRIESMLNGQEALEMDRSEEYASYIIEAHRTNSPFVVHGSVMNEGLVDNLPRGGCVEVPVMVDKNGYNPCRFGSLPEHLAALNRSHMAFHELTVQALLEGDKEAAVHALMLDPLTAAVCSLQEIRDMFNELYEGQREFIRAF